MSYLSSGFVAFAFSSWLKCSCVVLEMMIFYLSSYLSLLLITGKIYFTLLGTAYSTKIGGPSISRNGKLQRCNLDGSTTAALIWGDSDRPSSGPST